MSAIGGIGALTPLATELGDLKRLRDATSPDSIASRAFRLAWGRLLAGEAPGAVALNATANCIAACRLGSIDLPLLQAAGVQDPVTILQRSFDETAHPIAPTLRKDLRATLGHAVTIRPAPAFAEALIRQPRAGATCPGRPRLVLEPPEGHGDHCMIVAVLGVALSGFYGADPAVVFLAGLAHHLHNAFLPDSGFAGEILLADALVPLVRRLFEQELSTLPNAVAAPIRHALTTIGGLDTPEGRAFNAADVIDRVLQMKHYHRAASFTVDQALDDLQLVHAGPLQSFHHDVLADAGLP